MEDILNLAEWADDASSKTIEIYTAFIKKAVLEDADREKLKKERGFSDETIDLCNFKSCRLENRELVKELQEQFGEEALLEAGLLEAKEDGIKTSFQLLGTFKDEKIINNICIPYFNQDGEIFYIRPHKYGLKDKGINLYVPARKAAPEKTWIITESEFKAAAALQLGFPSIGLPGIHSFAVNNFDRLQEFIIQTGISNIVIVFDNEIKTNPAFKNYKPNVLKQWDTQWRNIDMCRKLLSKVPDLNTVKIGVLPASWMVEGKIDIDGALAQGKTTAEFKSIIYNAMDWTAYLETLPPVGHKLIKRKIYKEDCLSDCKIKKTEMGYVAERSKSGGRDQPPITFSEEISNFTMDIRKTLIEGGIHIREVCVRGQDGTISKPYICKQGTNILREFKTWIWGCGDFHFTGKQEDLDEIWQLEGALSDGREIHRPEQIGYLRGEDCPYWLFGNALLKENGSLLLPDEDGIIWEGLTGYIPRSIKEESAGSSSSSNKMPMVNLDETNTFSMLELKDVINKMEIIYGTKAIKLAVGWIVACLLSEEIYKRYACFPILFIGGKRESGKSTLGNWLMAMAGQSDTAGDSLSSTSQAGAERSLAWYSSLPYWLDEYRNNNKIKKWDGFFRNAFQRQAPSKGTLGSGVRSHNINAGIILSGEETPQDNALLSRCVIIPLVSRKHRDEKKEDIELFREIENFRIKGLLSRLILEVIKVKKKLLPTILDHIDGWKKRLLDEGAGERIALNYAIPAVCYDAIFLKDEELSVRAEFTKWVVTESFNSEKEKESEHMLAVFMEDLVTLSKDLEGFYAVYDGIKGDKGKRRIAIHFPTFYSIWAENYRRKGLDPFKRGTILSYIKEEPYFIEDNYLKRINGKPIRTLVLSLDKEDNTPSGLSYFDPKSEIAEAVTNAGDGSDVLGPPPDSSLDFGDPPI